MSDRKILLEITYHTDDDTGTYHIGEIDWAIRTSELDKYLKDMGMAGMKELMFGLSCVSHQIWKRYHELGERILTGFEYAKAGGSQSDVKYPSGVITTNRENLEWTDIEGDGRMSGA